MAAVPIPTLISTVRNSAYPLTGAATDYDPLLALIGDARLVLLGEASHGTHEFYRERAQITKRLITERGFNAIAAEADWPDAYRVNRYVRGVSDDAEAIDALGDFRRFPAWMWRNADVLDFIGWLRAYNDGRTGADAHAGFYGLDLYSLHRSREAVLHYLDRIDPEAAQRARYKYGCFDHFGDDVQDYAYAAGLGLSSSCENEVIHVLEALRNQAAAYLARNGRGAHDEFFYAEQNALLVKNAEHYYRSMFQARVSSWNLRDQHMAETLQALLDHLDRHQPGAKLILWAHNSHLGDARATQMGQMGELNLGQLVRERYGSQAVLIGFTTYSGTVTAASEWGAQAERKRVRSALPGSYEALLHGLDMPRLMLILRGNAQLESLREPRLERAIGVIYRPETERVSHYFTSQLTAQFDAVLHFDQTRAVEPLERSAPWEAGEVPETFPFSV
ncbi:MAG TPA: erythromycin esterase family protein [Gammaproteobacteria bacterium]|nr:erythromycin esterase family protein [Gammaproteobacteria bacterium]